MVTLFPPKYQLSTHTVLHKQSCSFILGIDQSLSNRVAGLDVYCNVFTEPLDKGQTGEDLPVGFLTCVT